MYLQILKYVINKNHDEKKMNDFNKRFRQVVESIVVLFDVLFSSALEDLFSVEKKNKFYFEIFTFFLEHFKK